MRRRARRRRRRPARVDAAARASRGAGAARAARNGCRASAARPSPACAPQPRTRRDHPGIAVWLGHALEDTGEAEAAADAYAHAHALAPDEPQTGRLPAGVATQAVRLARPRRAGGAGACCGATPDARWSSRSPSSVRTPPPPSSCNARGCAPARSPRRSVRCPLPPRACARMARPRRIPFQWLRRASHRPADRGAVRGICASSTASSPSVCAQPRRRQPDPPAPAGGHATLHDVADACRTRRWRGASAMPASTCCSTCAAGAAVARRKCWRCGRRRCR